MAHFPEAPSLLGYEAPPSEGKHTLLLDPQEQNKRENWGWGVRNEGSENPFKRTTQKDSKK